ncbi:MAG: HEAT repeat domain-containing protein [Pirellulales bacterium]|nr:HEAT repeat domain-containing protein [Pirellulales bacterium]
MTRISSGGLTAVLVVLACCAVARADVFVMENGGRVVGELLNPNETPRQTYSVRTSEGTILNLDRNQVKQILRPRPEEMEYEKMRPRYPDTVEGQWELAEWCREKTLLEQRDKHLRRILELNPDHEKARLALGYSQLDGRWMTQEEVMSGRGYVRHQNRWMLPQEIELLKEKQQIELAEKEWMQKIERWLSAQGAEEGRQAYQSIAAINDPFAVKALARALNGEGRDPRDPRDQARILAVEVLAKIGTDKAAQALAICAIEDPVEEVRLTSLDHLKKKDNPAAVDQFIGRLKSKENVEVNRAAAALKEMNNPKAIGPLIDALVTQHQFKIGGGSGGEISTTFTPSGPGGMSVGGNRPKIVKKYLTNRPVLEALVSLTGVNYSFDKQKWKAWYASQLRDPGMNARRD